MLRRFWGGGAPWELSCVTGAVSDGGGGPVTACIASSSTYCLFEQVTNEMGGAWQLAGSDRKRPIRGQALASQPLAGWVLFIAIFTLPEGLFLSAETTSLSFLHSQQLCPGTVGLHSTLV